MQLSVLDGGDHATVGDGKDAEAVGWGSAHPRRIRRPRSAKKTYVEKERVGTNRKESKTTIFKYLPTQHLHMPLVTVRLPSWR